MENSVQIFTNEEFGDIRTAGTPDNPKFCLADVCRSLEIGNPSDVKNRLDKGVVTIETLQTAGGMQKLTFINEDGLYDVILDSRKPSAKKFRKWITSEVLPSIRKTGGYLTPQKASELFNNPDAIIKICTEWKTALAEADKLRDIVDLQAVEIAELTPKADYCDKILQSTETLPISVIAKDYGMSGQAMNDTLRKLGIQYKLKSGIWLIYQNYANRGYTCTKTKILENGITTTHTYWTQKGRLFLYERLKQNGILPLIERDDEHGQLLLIKEVEETA